MARLETGRPTLTHTAVPSAPSELHDGGFVAGVAAAVLGVIVIGTLYFGREIFVPIALAVLLSFVLAPPVRMLQHWRVPRAISVVGVVLLAFLAIFAIGSVIAGQLNELAGDLPRYQATMREKIKSLRGAAATSGTLERAADVLSDLSKELERPSDRSARPGCADGQRAVCGNHPFAAAGWLGPNSGSGRGSPAAAGRA